MNFSAPFIRKPIATSLLMVAIVLLGIIGYELLPVAALPEVDSPTIQVTAQLPGADPQTVASSVATPLERQFGQIHGLAQSIPHHRMSRRRSTRPAATCLPIC